MTEQSEVRGTIEGADELAREWVQHLKQKTRIMSVTLAVLGAVAVLLLVTVVVFSSKNADFKVVLSEKGAQIDKLQVQNHEAKQEIQALQEQLAAVEKTKDVLEELKGDTATQLELAKKIIETQKEKIALMEGDYQGLDSQLKGVTSNLKKVSDALAGSKQTNQNLTKEVSERKLAYTALVNRQKDTMAEVQRISNALEVAKKKNQDLEVMLNVKDEAISNLKTKLNQTVVQLNELEKGASTLVTSTSTESSKVKANEVHSLAIQPIVAQPVTQPETTSSEDKVIDPAVIVID